MASEHEVPEIWEVMMNTRARRLAFDHQRPSRLCPGLRCAPSSAEHPSSMPTERISLSQPLSAVASKGRRLFSREKEAPSAPNLSEALERGWISTTSPYCLSNQLLAPERSEPGQSSSFGSIFGRRRSSNATVTSTSSVEGTQARRKSIFSKKLRIDEQPTLEVSRGNAPQFVDPFARQPHHAKQTAASLDRSWPSNNDQSVAGQGARSQQSCTDGDDRQQKREALSRVSDLVCSSPGSQTAHFPTLLSSSPAGDGYFYPIEVPSPTSPTGSSSGRSPSLVAFPHRIDARRGLRLNLTGEADSYDASLASPSLSTQDDSAMRSFASDPEEDISCLSAASSRETGPGQHQLLLPSSMKRQSSRAAESEASKRSMASLRVHVGHGSGRLPSSLSPGFEAPDWLLDDGLRPSLHPVPPLRPSRNPMRRRSKSLGPSSGAQGDGTASSPAPPLPPLPLSSAPSSESIRGAKGWAEPRNSTPVHTPPSTRPGSGRAARARDRGDSLRSAASCSSFQMAPFHTPTFGSGSWAALPVV